MTVASTLGACTVGPDYLRPKTAVPASFKEAPPKGWKRVSPLDAIDRGPWWEVYRDPALSALASQVDISNQNVASAAASYVAARELIKEAQSSLFPTVTASHATTGSHVTGSRTTLTFTPSATASWDLDLWGLIRRNVEASAAAAQVSAAELQDAKLSAEGSLLTAYFDLRATDALKDLYDRTAREYEKTLAITQNEFKSGTVSEADVVTAQTQLYGVQAAAIDTGVLRAQFEHAIAVLIGRPPADLGVRRNGRALPPPPPTPVVLPSRLLERRPDIAAAERTLQQDNALIGVAVANFYPDVNLTAMFSYAASPTAGLASAAWSAAGTATQPLLDGGLRQAELAAARATYDASVATYRQTVLTAFQQVEDALAALRVYAAEAKKDRETIDAARKAVTVYLNQYQAGTVAFTAVVTAQATLLTAEESLLAVQQDQLIESVTLIEAIGGGWHVEELPPIETLTPVSTLTPPL